MAQVGRAFVAGDHKRAVRLAKRLQTDCRHEARLRSEAARVLKLVEYAESMLDANGRQLLANYVARGNYRAVIVCGQGLLQRDPKRCSNPRRYSLGHKRTRPSQQTTARRKPVVAASALRPLERPRTAHVSSNPPSPKRANERPVNGHQTAGTVSATTETRAPTEFRRYPQPILLSHQQGIFAVGSAALATRAGVSFLHTSFDKSLLGLKSGTVDTTELTLYGYYVINDRVEIGAALPILTTFWTGTDSSTHLGNLRIDLKARIYGPSGSPLSVSYFANTTVPTMSASVDRGAIGVRIHHGLLVGGQKGIFHYRGGFSMMHLINSAGDHHLGDLSVYVGIKPHEMVTLQTTFQTVAALVNGGIPGLMVSPTLRVSPFLGTFAEFGVRVAINEQAMEITGNGLAPGGRVAYVASIGYRF
jgi:hypothetical protein